MPIGDPVSIQDNAYIRFVQQINTYEPNYNNLTQTVKL